jgi:hypothetical protein
LISFCTCTDSQTHPNPDGITPLIERGRGTVGNLGPGLSDGVLVFVELIEMKPNKLLELKAEALTSCYDDDDSSPPLAFWNQYHDQSSFLVIDKFTFLIPYLCKGLNSLLGPKLKLIASSLPLTFISHRPEESRATTCSTFRMLKSAVKAGAHIRRAFWGSLSEELGFFICTFRNRIWMVRDLIVAKGILFILIPLISGKTNKQTNKQIPAEAGVEHS